MLDLLLVVVAFVVILVGSELFTNGIEWFGQRLGLAEGAVGSVLAAVGTALPETIVPIVAILFSGSDTVPTDADSIGIGAILGAPFMLATLAMFVTGVAVLVRARGRGANDDMVVKAPVLLKDVGFFFAAYLVALGAAFLPAGADLARVAVACALLAGYAIYVRSHLGAEADIVAADLAALRFSRFMGGAGAAGPPSRNVINVQVLVALGLIVGGSVVFVDAIEGLAHSLSVAPLILALVVAPIATELPEKLNSVIWVRAGKDTLAMGNITGAMVFQACIPTTVGLVFAADAWRVVPGSTASLVAFTSAVFAFLSMAVIFVPLWRQGRLRGRGLLAGGLFYVAFLVLVVMVGTGAS